MKENLFLSTFPVFFNRSTDTYRTRWICRCEMFYKSTIRVHTSTPRVYDTSFNADICRSKAAPYIWMLTVQHQLAVAMRVCCLFALAEPCSLFICTLWVFWHDREKAFPVLDPGGLSAAFELIYVKEELLVPQSVVHLNQWFEGETHVLCPDSKSLLTGFQI